LFWSLGFLSRDGGGGWGSCILPLELVGYGTRRTRKKKTPNNRGRLPRIAGEKLKSP